MSFVYKDSFDEMVVATNAKSNTELQDRITRRANQEIRSIARIDSWFEMRRKLEITYSGSPVMLPPNLIGIDLVWDDTYYIEYIDRNRSATESDERMSRYFRYPIESVLAEVNDVAIAQNGTTFSSDALLALGLTTDDEWFYVEGEEQYYQITSNVNEVYTFAPAYRGVGSATGVHITVRPLSTTMLDLIGPLGADVSTTTIDLHYWEQPDLIRDVTDMVPLPSSDLLTFKVLSRMVESKKRNPIAQKLVDEVLDEALSQNPDKPRRNVLRGKNRNKIFDNGDPYGSRNNGSTSIRNPMECRWQQNPI